MTVSACGLLWWVPKRCKRRVSSKTVSQKQYVRARYNTTRFTKQHHEVYHAVLGEEAAGARSELQSSCILAMPRVLHLHVG